MRIRRPHYIPRPLLLLAALGVLGALAIAALASESAHGSGAGAAKEAAQGAGTAASTTAGHGSAPAAKGAHGGGNGGEKDPAAPVFRLGSPLNGYFDRTTLRSAARLSSFRYVFRDVRQTVFTTSPWMIRMSCAVEFGSETGMAEIEQEMSAVLTDIRMSLTVVPPERLLTASGKIRLKEEIARAINRRLLTARVRQVYFTDFLIAR